MDIATPENVVEEANAAPAAASPQYKKEVGGVAVDRLRYLIERIER